MATIAIVTEAWHPQKNGVVRALESTTVALRRQGHRVHLITPRQFIRIPVPRYPNIQIPIFPRRNLGRILQRHRPDAIHIATEGWLGLEAKRFCENRGFPYTTSYHTHVDKWIYKNYGIPGDIVTSYCVWFRKNASCTMVSSEALKMELAKKGYTNLKIWPRGVDLELFRPRDPIDLGTGPIIMYVGRVSEEKNIDAFLHLDLPGKKVVVGDGPYLQELKRRYPDTLFVGEKKGRELARYYSSANVMVFPSRWDTLGLVLVEALACGTPVASFPEIGPKQFIQLGINGYYSEDLRTAILTCLDIQDRQYCRQSVAHYTWHESARIFHELLAPIQHWPRSPRKWYQITK